MTIEFSEREIIQTRISREGNGPLWDDFVLHAPQSVVYHLFAWKRAVEASYRHDTYYIIATKEPYPQSLDGAQKHAGRIAGILPMVHLKHILLGNSLISLPFCDLGGIVSEDVQTEKALISRAVSIGRNLRVKTIELRHKNPLSLCLKDTNLADKSNGVRLNSIQNKHTLILTLPSSSDRLFSSFKSKLRSQIRKPLKEGLDVKIGGDELLNDFYHVISVNMRDLGSPVHSRSLFQNVMREFKEKARIVIIHRDNQAMACSLIIGFKNVLENPWASSIRRYSRLAPNMLLYWAMLKYACDNGYDYFDFGRSSPSDGTYKFKEQWGARPYPLCWQTLSMNGTDEIATPSKSSFRMAIKYWRTLPVPLTRLIGPMIRRNIGL